MGRLRISAHSMLEPNADSVRTVTSTQSPATAERSGELNSSRMPIASVTMSPTLEYETSGYSRRAWLRSSNRVIVASLSLLPTMIAGPEITSVRHLTSVRQSMLISASARRSPQSSIRWSPLSHEEKHWPVLLHQTPPHTKVHV